MAIWQDLVSEAGFTRGYQSVWRFVRKLRGSQIPQAHPAIVTAPGEEAQVDYGTGPMVRDPQSGKYRRTRLFVMTLGYSRKSVRLLVFQSNSRTWAELHEKSFRRLGGAVRLIVLDNLREGVLVPDLYDPTLNPLYRDMLQHYGAAALELQVHEYRFVRRYLERHPQARLSFQQVDPLIRELVHYRDLIQQRVNEQEKQGSLFPTISEELPKTPPELRE